MSNDEYKELYLKYKLKYLHLKNNLENDLENDQTGGGLFDRVFNRTASTPTASLEEIEKILTNPQTIKYMKHVMDLLLYGDISRSMIDHMIATYQAYNEDVKSITIMFSDKLTNDESKQQYIALMSDIERLFLSKNILELKKILELTQGNTSSVINNCKLEEQLDVFYISSKKILFDILGFRKLTNNIDTIEQTIRAGLSMSHSFRKYIYLTETQYAFMKALIFYKEYNQNRELNNLKHTLTLIKIINKATSKNKTETQIMKFIDDYFTQFHFNLRTKIDTNNNTEAVDLTIKKTLEEIQLKI